MNIVFIGAGNTATVLATKLKDAGHSILQIYSRNQAHAAVLAQQVDAEPIQDLGAITKKADLCIIAVPDQAIPIIASQLHCTKKILVHTAGAVSKDLLQSASPNYGVLYPLQRLRKELTQIPEIPFLIDGNSQEITLVLADLAASISQQVMIANDEMRLKMHLAAVLTGNFSNHLFALTQAYCRKNNLPFQFLSPIIHEVVDRLSTVEAAASQTGPAIRGDQATMQQHLDLLLHEPMLKSIYELFSQSIQGFYPKKQEL